MAEGKRDKPDVAAMPDLSTRELWLLAPIAAVVLWMGVYPERFLKPMRVSIASLVERVEGAAPEGDDHLAADRKSTRLNSSHQCATSMPSSACKNTTQKDTQCNTRYECT